MITGTDIQIATTPPVIARSGSDEAIPKLNPKLKALNPKQYQR